MPLSNAVHLLQAGGMSATDGAGRSTHKFGALDMPAREPRRETPYRPVASCRPGETNWSTPTL